MTVHHRIGEQSPMGRPGLTMSIYACEKCRCERLRHNRDESIGLFCNTCDQPKLQRLMREQDDLLMNSVVDLEGPAACA